MFHMIFKLFAIGSATLPSRGGVETVGRVLGKLTKEEFANSANCELEVKLETVVELIEEEEQGFVVGGEKFDRVIVACNEVRC